MRLPRLSIYLIAKVETHKDAVFRLGICKLRKTALTVICFLNEQGILNNGYAARYGMITHAKVKALLPRRQVGISCYCVDGWFHIPIHYKIILHILWSNTVAQKILVNKRSPKGTHFRHAGPCQRFMDSAVNLMNASFQDR